MMSSETEQYCGVLAKFSIDNNIMPLITVCSTKNGGLAIFADNNKLTHDQKVEVLQMAAQVAARGAKEERDQMTKLDPKRFKIG